jgi:riboflavin transporter FmnP
MFRKSVTTANIIVFSSLAIILTALKAEVPFPVLTYLKFDFAEIPVMIVLFLFGPIPALLTETVHWIALMITRGWVLGPLMKFLAVVPMILGFWFGTTIYRRFKKGTPSNIVALFGLGIVLGIITRVIVTTLANLVVFLFVAPEWVGYAQYMLGLVGIHTATTVDVIAWTLLLTATFNILHVPLSSFVAMIAVKGTVIRLPNLTEKIWIPTIVRTSKEST